MVWWTSAARIGSELAMRAPIALGGGSRMKGMPAPRVTASQMIRIQTPKIDRDEQPQQRARAPAGRPAGRTACVTQRQASSQAAASSRKKGSRAVPSKPAMPASSSQAGEMRADEQDAAPRRARGIGGSKTAAAASEQREDQRRVPSTDSRRRADRQRRASAAVIGRQRRGKRTARAPATACQERLKPLMPAAPPSRARPAGRRARRS